MQVNQQKSPNLASTSLDFGECFNAFPKETLLNMLEFLPPNTLGSLLLTNKSWKILAVDSLRRRFSDEYRNSIGCARTLSEEGNVSEAISILKNLIDPKKKPAKNKTVCLWALQNNDFNLILRLIDHIRIREEGIFHKLCGNIVRDLHKQIYAAFLKNPSQNLEGLDRWVDSSTNNTRLVNILFSLIKEIILNNTSPDRFYYVARIIEIVMKHNLDADYGKGDSVMKSNPIFWKDVVELFNYPQCDFDEILLGFERCLDASKDKKNMAALLFEIFLGALKNKHSFSIGKSWRIYTKKIIKFMKKHQLVDAFFWGDVIHHLASFPIDINLWVIKRSGIKNLLSYYLNLLVEELSYSKAFNVLQVLKLVDDAAINKECLDCKEKAINYLSNIQGFNFSDFNFTDEQLDIIIDGFIESHKYEEAKFFVQFLHEWKRDSRLESIDRAQKESISIEEETYKENYKEFQEGPKITMPEEEVEDWLPSDSEDLSDEDGSISDLPGSGSDTSY